MPADVRPGAPEAPCAPDKGDQRWRSDAFLTYEPQMGSWVLGVPEFVDEMAYFGGIWPPASPLRDAALLGLGGWITQGEWVWREFLRPDGQTSMVVGSVPVVKAVPACRKG